MSDDLTTEEVDSLSDAMGNGSKERESTPPEDTPVPKMESNGDTAASSSVVEEEVETNISRAQLLQLEELAGATDLPPKEMDRMYDLKVKVEVILGRSKMSLEEVLRLQNGSVVELDKLAGEPVDITVNGKLIARAEIVVVEENFGVKVLEIAGTKQKLGAIREG